MCWFFGQQNSEKWVQFLGFWLIKVNYEITYTNINLKWANVKWELHLKGPKLVLILGHYQDSYNVKNLRNLSKSFKTSWNWYNLTSKLKRKLIKGWLKVRFGSKQRKSWTLTLCQTPLTVYGWIFFGMEMQIFGTKTFKETLN